MTFHNKVAIVTGGASGIGHALCKELAKRNAVVIVADIDSQAATEVTSALVATGGRVDVQTVDVTDPNAVRGLVDQVVKKYGKIDLVVNNAGVGIIGDMRDMRLEHWQQIMNVNLWGVIHGTTAAYEIMTKQGAGHIVNIASAGGVIPLPMATAYTTTKFGVVGLSTALRTEAAPLGIRVSVVCPGGVQTKIIETATLLKMDRQKLIPKIPSLALMDADRCAQLILRGIARNKAIITVPRSAQLGVWLYRLCPGLLLPIISRIGYQFRLFRDGV
ncbi:MAG: SDR family NAD(P)-dependent oxidoreductase [Chloroflexota bacterium]